MGDAIPNAGGTDTFITQATGSASLSSATAGNVVMTSRGKDINTYTVTMQNTTAAASETAVFGATSVVISKNVASTAAQVAAATVTSSPSGSQWGNLSAIGTTTTAIPDTYTSTPLKDLWSFVPGYLKNTRD